MILAKDDHLCNILEKSHRIDWVALDALPIVWPLITPLLIKSLDQFTTLEAAYEAIASGIAKLWVIHSSWIDGFVITGVSNNIGVIVNCGGKNIKKWIHLLDVIENDFKANGCVRWQMAGRKGWKKLINFDDECHLFTKVL